MWYMFAGVVNCLLAILNFSAVNPLNFFVGLFCMGVGAFSFILFWESRK